MVPPGLDRTRSSDVFAQAITGMTAFVQAVVNEPRTARNIVIARAFGHDHLGDSKLSSAIVGSFLPGPIPAFRDVAYLGWVWERSKGALVEKVTLQARSSSMYEAVYGPTVAFWPPPLLDQQPELTSGGPLEFYGEWLYESVLTEAQFNGIWENMVGHTGVCNLGWARVLDDKGRLVKDKWVIQVAGDASFDLGDFNNAFAKTSRYKVKKHCLVCFSGPALGDGHASADCPVLKRISGSRVKAGYKKLTGMDSVPYMDIEWTLEEADVDVRGELRTLTDRIEKLEGRIANLEKGTSKKRKQTEESKEVPQAKKPKGGKGKAKGNDTGKGKDGATSAAGGAGGKKGKGKSGDVFD